MTHVETIAQRRYRENPEAQKAYMRAYKAEHPKSYKANRELQKELNRGRVQQLREVEIGCDILCAFIRGKRSDE
jgi:hypothetical protein